MGHDHGAEALVERGVLLPARTAVPREPSRELDGECLRLARDDHVQLARLETERQIAYRAADQLDVLARARDLEQLATAGQRAQAFEHGGRVENMHPRQRRSRSPGDSHLRRFARARPRRPGTTWLGRS